eukprot:TRINITY_DN1464_c0_g2_i2.p1 TRINITY_DN1464_c0_g2~~TRINITY_DN1464_c0_g2_i2.p1  ORF type:complete len:307 (-),score=68.35 TRINITY_DN1464_c0_g2_i2:70-990(-)
MMAISRLILLLAIYRAYVADADNCPTYTFSGYVEYADRLRVSWSAYGDPGPVTSRRVEVVPADFSELPRLVGDTNATCTAPYWCNFDVTARNLSPATSYQFTLYYVCDGNQSTATGIATTTAEPVCRFDPITCNLSPDGISVFWVSPPMRKRGLWVPGEFDRDYVYDLQGGTSPTSLSSVYRRNFTHTDDGFRFDLVDLQADTTYYFQLYTYQMYTGDFDCTEVISCTTETGPTCPSTDEYWELQSYAVGARSVDIKYVVDPMTLYMTFDYTIEVRNSGLRSPFPRVAHVCVCGHGDWRSALCFDF